MAKTILDYHPFVQVNKTKQNNYFITYRFIRSIVELLYNQNPCIIKSVSSLRMRRSHFLIQTPPVPHPPRSRNIFQMVSFFFFALLLVSVHLVTAANYCGTSYSNSFKCETSCPRGIDSECPDSETCYADVTCSSPSTGNYCGSTFSDADKCESSCPKGLDGECPSGERCYADVSCSSDPSPTGFPEKIVDKAKAEHGNYGGLSECGSASMRARIGEYWDALGLNRDGCVDSPWSATFVSYMVRIAGGGDRFKYSAGHRVYIKSAFAGGRGLYNSVKNLQTSTVREGDLVCTGRGSVGDWTYADFVDWYEDGATVKIPTHCDIVVGVSGSSFNVIGGNVGNTVTRRDRTKSNYAILLPVTRS